MNELFRQQVAVIGAGNIGRVLLERLRRGGMTVKMAVYDIDPAKAQAAAALVGAAAVSESGLASCGANIWLLCQGPKAVLPFLKKFSPNLKPGHLVVSFAAAVPVDCLEALVPPGVNIARVMPNMPSLTGRGMNPVCFSESCAPDARNLVAGLLSTLGDTVEVSDAQMNWCVGLSGAAMRSLLPVIEGMILAGREAGLTDKEARKIAAQVMLGTASLVTQYDDLSLDQIKAMTPMETVDEAAIARVFCEAARSAKEKIDRLQAAILSES